MGAQVIGYEFLPPFEVQMGDGVTLTLDDILTAAQLSNLPTSVSTTVSLAGVSFDDGCGSVTAGV